VEATWSGDVDVDLALLHPAGHRVSWLGAPTRSVISARDVTSRRSEGLALRGAEVGEYVIEVVRASGEGAPVSGEVVVTVAGTRKVLPFRLDGARATVGLAGVKLEQQLVPMQSWGGW
jgi:hypothetical protein